MAHDPVPVFLLTGFLGSGKTTLLNRLFKKYPHSALLINELGSIGIDDQLVKHNGMPVYLMAGGCICCTVQNELLLTLRNLFIARDAGDLPSFERLIIETTGAADPSSVIQLLKQDRYLKRNGYLAAVITTIDAEVGEQQLENYPEVIDQILAADIVLMTKCDRADLSQQDSLEQALQEIHPGLEPIRVFNAEHPADLLNQVKAHQKCRVTGIAPESTMPRLQPVTEIISLAPPGALLMTPKGLSGLIQTGRHKSYQAASLRIDQGYSVEEIIDGLAEMFTRCGKHLLRFKGIFAIEGIATPYLVQWAAPRLEMPEMLPAWPSDDHSSRMVLIVQHEDSGFAKSQLEFFESFMQKNRKVSIRVAHQSA